jgi:ankyrin repeat protein
LIHAAIYDRTEIANSLITSGASLDLKDKEQKTALIYAVERGRTDIAEMLLTAGTQI